MLQKNLDLLQKVIFFYEINLRYTSHDNRSILVTSSSTAVCAHHILNGNRPFDSQSTPTITLFVHSLPLTRHRHDTYPQSVSHLSRSIAASCIAPSVSALESSHFVGSRLSFETCMRLAFHNTIRNNSHLFLCATRHNVHYFLRILSQKLSKTETMCM